MKNLIFIFLIITKVVFGQDEAFYYPNHFDIAPNKVYKEIHKSFLNGNDIKSNHITCKTIEYYNTKGLKIKTELPSHNRPPTIIKYTYDNCDNLTSEIKYFSNNFIDPDSLLITYTYGLDCQISRKITYSNINRHNTSSQKDVKNDTIRYSFNTNNNIVTEYQNTKSLFFGSFSSIKTYDYKNGQIIKTIKLEPSGNFVDTTIQTYNYDDNQNLKSENLIRKEERNVTDNKTKRYVKSEKVKYYYDKKNRLIKKIGETSKIKYYFNDTGQITKIKLSDRSIFWKLFGSLGFKEFYIYNTDNNLEKITRKNPIIIFGLISYKMEYQVEYVK